MNEGQENEYVCRGNIILCKVWDFLQNQQLVPWATDPKSPSYDTLEGARWEGRQQALKEIENIIVETSNRLKSESK